MSQPLPKSILFVCYLNSIRSPMAQGVMSNLYPNIHVQSCGLAAGELDDLMVSVMREKSIDMSGHNAQTLGDVSETPFDLVIAFTDSAADAAEAVFSEVHTVIERWPMPDPTQGSLDVRAMMNNYRAIRDNIELRLQRRFGKL